MTNAMETLYNEWLESYKETAEMRNAFDVLCEGKNFDESNQKYYMLTGALNEENKNAFSAGFETAVQLLIGSIH